MKLAVILLIYFIVQIAVITALEHRNPQRAAAWIFLTFCCPPLGLPLYALLGRNYRPLAQKGNDPVSLPEPTVSFLNGRTGSAVKEGDWTDLLSRLSPYPLTAGSGAEVLEGAADTYRSMLAAIELAEEHIHLEVYILRDDDIGGKFQDVLIRKAKQGVRVRVLCDGLGSLALGRRYGKMLKRAGASFHYFLPWQVSLRTGRLNFRNHRKLLIVDGLTAFTGGINIGDDYLGENPKLGYWRDRHLRLTGDAVYEVQRLFLTDWQAATGERLSHPRFFPLHASGCRERVQMVGSGPDGDIDATQVVYFNAVCSARDRIWVMTPYFIPDSAMLRALKGAALRGVDVRVIIPAKPDNRLVYYTTLSYLENLQDAGIRFYRYGKGFMHAKTVVIDDRLAFVGSANLDMRSMYSNFELTALLMEPSAAAGLGQAFEQDLKDSEYMDPAVFRERGKRAKLLESLCRLLSPLL